MEKEVYIINSFMEVDTLLVDNVDQKTEAELKAVGNWFTKKSAAIRARNRALAALKEE